MQLPLWLAPTLVFSAALAVALRASAWFTRLLEDLGDQWGMSPGLLSFVSALGANIPNYAASLAAFAGGHGSVGLGIIVGSNIYNLAVILGLVSFATPGRRGVALALSEVRDVRRVARLATSMAVTMWLAFVLFGLGHTPQQPLPLSLWLATGIDLLTLCLFLGLVVHAFQRVPHHRAVRSTATAAASQSTVRLLILCVLALALALAGVIVMVQAGQLDGADLHLPTALLSLVVLAVATSLPNTVVAYQLARTARTSTGVEEILSSNGINIALGSALPLLIWRDGVDALLLRLDMPLLCILSLIALVLVRARRISRLIGASLLCMYTLWVVFHVLA